MARPIRRRGVAALEAMIGGFVSPGLALAAAYPEPVAGDFVIRDFRFTTAEVLPELRLHYLTIGTPRRDAPGVVRNAVLIAALSYFRSAGAADTK